MGKPELIKDYPPHQADHPYTSLTDDYFLMRKARSFFVEQEGIPMTLKKSLPFHDPKLFDMVISYVLQADILNQINDWTENGIEVNEEHLNGFYQDWVIRIIEGMDTEENKLTFDEKMNVYERCIDIRKLFDQIKIDNDVKDSDTPEKFTRFGLNPHIPAQNVSDYFHIVLRQHLTEKNIDKFLIYAFQLRKPIDPPLVLSKFKGNKYKVLAMMAVLCHEYFERNSGVKHTLIQILIDSFDQFKQSEIKNLTKKFSDYTTEISLEAKQKLILD